MYGTCLIMKKMLPHLLEALITNQGKGETVLIPRISLIPTDMAFDFKQLQFTVRVSFVMTINHKVNQ